MVHVNEQGSILFFEFHHKLDAVSAAKKLGFKTLLLAKTTDAEAEKTFDEVIVCQWSQPGELSKAVAKLKTRGDVRAVMTNYEHFVVQRAYLSHQLSLPAPSMSAACATRNKALQRVALNALPENIANALVSELAVAEKLFIEFGGDVFLKAIAGIKSRFVFHVESVQELRDAWQKFQQSAAAEKLDEELYDDFSYLNIDFHYPDPSKNLLLEKACYGQQIAASSLVLENGVWHTPCFTDIYTASDLGRADSFLAFRVLPSKHNAELVTKVNNLVEKVTNSLGLKSCAFFGDFMLTPQGELKIIEVASRIGGYRPMMYREVYGFDLTEFLIKSLTGQQFSAETVPQKFVSLCEFFPGKNGQLQEIECLAELKNDPDLLWLNVKAQKGQAVGLAKEGFEPVVVALLQGKTYEEVYQKSLYYQEKLKIITH